MDVTVNQHQQLTILATTFTLLIASVANAAELAGTIAAAHNDVVTITVPSGISIAVGDKAEVSVEVPDVGRADVGKGRVTAVNGNSVTAVINEATGKLAVGQRATVYASGGGAPPDAVGSSSTAGSAAVDPRDSRFRPSPKVRAGQAWLGMTADDCDAGLCVEVLGVLRGGPAAKAGLQAADVIESLGGKSIEFDSQFRDAERQGTPGDTVELVFVREGERRTAEVTFEPIPPDGGAGRVLAAAEAGETWAMYDMVWRYYGFDGYRGRYLAPEHHNKAKAVEWLRRAHETGYAPATHMLAAMHIQGDPDANIVADLPKAVRLFEQALREAEMAGLKWTMVSIQVNLVDALLDHPAVRNERRAIAIIQECADRGLGRPVVKLAKRYEAGKGVTQNTERALHWYHVAAQMGEATAYCSIGEMAYEGRGVERDYAVARDWFKLAADDGFGSAAEYLATMCERGEGAPRNIADAVRWHELAAEQGMLKTVIGREFHRAGQLYELHAAELGLAPAEARARAVERYKQAAANYSVDAIRALQRLGVR